ncbi:MULTISPECIES: siphovirus ReqiPepy6 Gp37-like family protein [Streptomyces]|uniref:siphovirus ReqiPepy6 Gp37-like family protein n=1 Tax=Streptomyces TaxID=1883 RepID=UPI001E306410|nr:MULTISPECIES: siphovirus ReqiPepy6 Gp37-like family protein [Streptomyces]UFQ16417.1 siphovirus ReqiPepy6 Gp37-like family protein [Streptomyces huasconensis]WCL86020.1 siphovirus ReqiPepy6 Gp37-like family protein [Streptomyces sp. JCM 35825]
MGYRILVRGGVYNGERRILGEIDTWIKLDFTVRFNQPGTWQLLVKSGTYQEGLLTQGRGVVIYQDGVPEPVFSGQIDAFERYWTTDQHTDVGSVFVGGKCDNQFPYGFLAFPGVTGAGTDQMTVLPVDQQYKGKDTRAAGGPLGQALWVEADLAFGARGLPDRKIGALNVGTNPGIGPTFTDSLRFDNLGAKFEEWLKDKRVGYRFIWSYETKQIEMKFYECRDRSADIRFSPELGNLKQYTWQLKAPEVTRAIVACQGEGAERYLWQKIDTEGEQQWGVKRETLVDRRDIPLKTGKDGKPELVTKVDSSTGLEDIGLNPDGHEWTPDLTAKRAALVAADKAVEAAEKAAADAKTDAEKQAAATRLAQAKANQAQAKFALVAAIAAAKPTAVAHYVKAIEEAATNALKEGEKSGHFQIYPIDTEQTKFGRDYFVGDIVTIAVDGTEYTDVVKEVNISVEDGGRVLDVTPKIGNQGTGEPLNLYKTVWDMKAKLRKLESRM